MKVLSLCSGFILVFWLAGCSSGVTEERLSQVEATSATRMSSLEQRVVELESTIQSMQGELERRRDVATFRALTIEDTVEHPNVRLVLKPNQVHLESPGFTGGVSLLLSRSACGPNDTDCSGDFMIGTVTVSDLVPEGSSTDELLNAPSLSLMVLSGIGADPSPTSRLNANLDGKRHDVLQLVDTVIVDDIPSALMRFATVLSVELLSQGSGSPAARACQDWLLRGELSFTECGFVRTE